MKNNTNDSDKDYLNSLDKFFYETDDSNLNNCDREPIHYIGSVHNIAILLILNSKTLQIAGYSQNLNEKLGIDLSRDSSPTLKTIFPDIQIELDEVELQAEEPHLFLDTMIKGKDENYQIVCHQHAGRVFLEFFPAPEQAPEYLSRQLRNARRWTTRIMAAETFDIALDLAAKATAELTGYKRVFVYKFLPDWSGQVLAESNQSELAPFLGLRFPATDIPRQARYLLQKNPYRGIPSTEIGCNCPIVSMQPSEQPIDLSQCLIRGTSEMHRIYLENMGTKASFNASLIHSRKLWGIISCHNDRPGFVPVDTWGIMEGLATTLMVKLDQDQLKKKNNMGKNLRKIEEKVAQVLKESEDLESAIVSFIPEFRKFLSSDGFAFILGNSIYLDGETPPKSTVKDLIQWALAKKELTGTFYTDDLSSMWAEAENFKEKACGVLIEPIKTARKCYLLWFRAPITTKVTWAGNPHKESYQLRDDGQKVLLPRNSFAEWQETHRNKSESWSPEEVEASSELLKNMLDIVSSQTQLFQSKQNLQVFSYAAAHDFKTPIRHLKSTLNMVAESIPEELSELNQLLEIASNSSQRLEALVKKLTQYLILGDAKVADQKVELDEVLADTLKEFEKELKSIEANVTVKPLPLVYGDKELMVSLFSNLVGNAIKYRNPEEPFKLLIESRALDNTAKIFVEDNGMGIEPSKREFVFTPFKRLHSYDNIPGSGLGLTISRRIAEVHGGTLELDEINSKGARFVLTLIKP